MIYDIKEEQMSAALTSVAQQLSGLQRAGLLNEPTETVRPMIIRILLLERMFQNRLRIAHVGRFWPGSAQMGCSRRP